jgi:hypothetical protein
MRQVTNFAVQNWLITPAALSVSETPPATIADQKFVLVLSGVGVVDYEFEVAPVWWSKEDFLFLPDLQAPLTWAAATHAIPRPGGDVGLTYHVAFQVDQHASAAGLGSIYSDHDDGHFGYAVDQWRLNPHHSAADVDGVQRARLFTGVQVELAMHTDKQTLYRVHYHFTLLGRIVFLPVVIT